MKSIIAFFIVGIVGLAGILCMGFATENVNANPEFLRIHIRANSNAENDQNIKYLVKQYVVEKLNPLFENVKSKKQAIETLCENLAFIESLANEVLTENGFDYTAFASVKSELFPTRAYATSDKNVTLPEGVYDALIIDLGKAMGDNWFCCIYPPLCFLENNLGGNETVNYRFKILDLFKK